MAGTTWSSAWPGTCRRSPLAPGKRNMSGTCGVFASVLIDGRGLCKIKYLVVRDWWNIVTVWGFHHYISTISLQKVHTLFWRQRGRVTLSQSLRPNALHRVGEKHWGVAEAHSAGQVAQRSKAQRITSGRMSSNVLKCLFLAAPCLPGISRLCSMSSTLLRTEGRYGRSCRTTPTWVEACALRMEGCLLSPPWSRSTAALPTLRVIHLFRRKIAFVHF